MKSMEDAKSWIEVSEGALRENLEALRSTLRDALAPNRLPSSPPPGVLAVIKANGYGHGAKLCAPVLARAGAEWLGVTDADEGAAVRGALTTAGLPFASHPQILVMCGLERSDVSLILEHRLTPVVWFAEQLEWLATHTRPDERLPIHLEVDTGMARQGVRPGVELAALLDCLIAEPRLRLDGVMTHFASSEIANSTLTAAQQQRFEVALAQVRQSGLKPSWIHAGNTSTIDEARLLPWVAGQAQHTGSHVVARTGLALYGYALPLEGATAELAPSLQPVGTWKTHIIALRDLAPGETVGYNATFTATGPMRLALLPVGYADGLRRELSSTDTRNGGWVMLHGQPAPIVGRISMNLTTVDVSAIPEAALGDQAVLLGEGVSAADHARLAGTIPYEILCAMRAARRLIT